MISIAEEGQCVDQQVSFVVMCCAEHVVMCGAWGVLFDAREVQRRRSDDA